MDTPTPDYRKILLSLCAGMCLADHMGDVAGDVWKALEDAGFPPPEDAGDLDDIGQWLGKEHGVQTVWGTDIYDPDLDASA